MSNLVLENLSSVGLPGGTSGKNLHANAEVRDVDLILGQETPWKGK